MRLVTLYYDSMARIKILAPIVLFIVAVAGCDEPHTDPYDKHPGSNPGKTEDFTPVLSR